MASIPIETVLEKLKQYLNKGDYEAAEKHLNHWMGEAEAIHDDLGKLSLLSEQIGLFKRTEQPWKGLAAIDAVLWLCKKNEDSFDETISLGTTYADVAAGCNSFGELKKAIVFYRKAQVIYEKFLTQDDFQLAALYNNMAITLADLKESDEAMEYYKKALEIMEIRGGNELESAITYLNMADLVCEQKGMEEGELEIENYLDMAEDLFDREEIPRDPYYAFMCDKCVSTFGYYGYFAAEKKLKQRVDKIWNER